MTTEIDLTKAANLLGYASIKWDADNNCYSGYGSSDDFDRSRDDVGGLFIASTDDDLLQIIAQAE